MTMTWISLVCHAAHGVGICDGISVPGSASQGKHVCHESRRISDLRQDLAPNLNDIICSLASSGCVRIQHVQVWRLVCLFLMVPIEDDCDPVTGTSAYFDYTDEESSSHEHAEQGPEPRGERLGSPPCRRGRHPQTDPRAPSSVPPSCRDG